MLAGSCEAKFRPMADNGLGLFLILELRRIIFNLVKGCVDHSGKRKKVMLKCGNVRRQRMNSRHARALTELARAFAGIESDEVTVTSVDKLGFHVRFKTPEGMRGARIAFLRAANNPEEARIVVTDMVTEARKK